MELRQRRLPWVVLFACTVLLQHVTVANAAAAAAGGSSTGVNDARFVYNKSKADVGAESTDADTDTNVKLLDENETDSVSTNKSLLFALRNTIAYRLEWNPYFFLGK